MSISKYDKRHWGYFLLAIVAAIPMALFMGYASRTGLLGDNVWLTFGVFITIGTGVWWLTIIWWRTLDDVHKQGQLTSWYWGSAYGGFAFMIWLMATNSHHTSYSEGAFHMLLTQFAVAAVLYGVWKWRGSSFGPGAKK